ncbi:hypothetical protein F5Y14DRAFT_459534 [Nemania sp. NC0429]|nr:hypothetical protein F5Y14DRAFT_459534 [Nemania sp. NC0429]
MNRRAQHSTDQSNDSVDSEVARDIQAAWQSLAATDLEQLVPSAVLQRSLTVRSVVSTTSSFATRSQRLKNATTQNYQEIGRGLQGIVYERIGSISVTKKELPTNPGRRLSIEFAMHRTVWDAFGKYAQQCNDVRVPKPHEFIPGDSLSLELLSRMPEGDRRPGNIVTMERILPLPKVVRKAMIQEFYPNKNTVSDERMVTRLLSEPANKYCLARVYLGKESMTMSEGRFTLQNFPLTLDLMDKLGLDMERFAKMIGSAYAIMHWAAHNTGDDVEFVLGTSTSADRDFQKREIHMYLLDFGQCDTVDMSEDQDDIFQAFKGAMVLQPNQLYLPHPRRSPSLYQAWKSAYRSTAREVIRCEGLPFNPEEFLEEYEEYLEDFYP